MDGITVMAQAITTAIATVGSILAILITEAIKERYFKPRVEFAQLQRKVNSSLSMYACYYCNQIDPAKEDMVIKEKYSDASKAIRELAVEVSAFADSLKDDKCCGINRKDILEAGRQLMGLSNSFFTPYNAPEMRENRDNHSVAKEIRSKIGIHSR